ncbi:glutaredoxin family protein [Prochlorococcus sp. MIT 1223]|uniref:glutaredoxin family protein n=1 Tax=Prochlorococcus sp. MIT 1223 TaxID=3096217 RepID=UPI002A761AD3|nr:glutaredoxin family protein [Prochlorococcus sp. MIT 1223]
MKEASLYLYSRTGCCLCEGLEQRLKNVDLSEIEPSLVLKVIDIDSELIPKDVKASFDLRVPVLVLSSKDKNLIIELPMVSPRLKGRELLAWMQKTLNKLI